MAKKVVKKVTRYYLIKDSSGLNFVKTYALSKNIPYITTEKATGKVYHGVTGHMNILWHTGFISLHIEETLGFFLANKKIVDKDYFCIEITGIKTNILKE
jgi:hypothetical protein